MKKVIIICSLITVVLACNSGDTSEKKTGDSNEVAAVETPADPQVAMGLKLLAQSDCLTCHKLDEPLIGPSYTAVAAKYDNNAQVIDTISKKIITGGAGNWGTVPMTAHPTITEEDAKAMMKYIMSLKK